MGPKFKEAYVSLVAEDDHLEMALLLAESLGRSGTARPRVALVGRAVSFGNRMILERAFDLVVSSGWTQVDTAFGTSAHNHGKARANLAAELGVGKLVFIPHSHVVLENLDYLFRSDFGAETAGWADEAHRFNGIFWCTSTGEGSIAYAPGLERTTLCSATGALSMFSCRVPYVEVVGSLAQLTCVDQAGLSVLEKAVVQRVLELNEQALAKVEEDGTMPPPPLEPNEPVAIIGMGCRLPGANNPAEFWSLLEAGCDATSLPPEHRWTKEHALEAATAKERQTRAGFLSQPIDQFDTEFFNLSPLEVAFMDPQTRLLHEVTWEALENAGVDPTALRGSATGVFLGTWRNDYRELVELGEDRDFFKSYFGNSRAGAVARISALLGSTGPAVSHESACATGMMTVHLALQHLRNNSCQLAIAGAANLILKPFSKETIPFLLAADGRCKAFDADADGFGRGEGCGVLLLKRLSDALRDCDHIWGVIRGSGVAQEEASVTPTVRIESLAIARAFEDAGLEPSQVSYVEAHGTGTKVGDQVEIAALQQVYSAGGPRQEPLLIGSVKNNVGHTESASAITSIIKTLLAMKHQLVPKHLNVRKLNPELPLSSIPAIVPLVPTPWPRDPTRGPRLAAVSSAGITGTAGHLILEEAPAASPRFGLRLDLERPIHLIKITAKSEEALKILCTGYAKFLEGSSSASWFRDVVHTANTGRANFPWRTLVLASSGEECARKLAGGHVLQGHVDPTARSDSGICFLFPGQGCQYVGMCRQLYEQSPVVRVALDSCDALFQELYQMRILPVIWGNDEDLLAKTAFSQPAIFAVEYALLELWQSWGIRPTHVAGHSLGEFAAAVAAGVLELRDAIFLVVERCKLLDKLESGKMMAVEAGKLTLTQIIAHAGLRVDIAAVNSPQQTVVAGPSEHVDLLAAKLRERGLRCTVLKASHAFHSRMMDPMLGQWRQVVKSVQWKSGNVHGPIFVSGLEGRPVGREELCTASYWVRHIRQPVNFLAAANCLLSYRGLNFVEVGPQPVLSTFVLASEKATDEQQLNVLPTLRKGADDWETALSSLGKAYLLNFPVDWSGLDLAYDRKKVDGLPSHPFSRKSYWTRWNGCQVLGGQLGHPLVGFPTDDRGRFEKVLSPRNPHYLSDHKVGDRILYPGAAFLEQCCWAGAFMSLAPCQPTRLTNFTIHAPLEFSSDPDQRRIRTQVERPSAPGLDYLTVSMFSESTSSEGSRTGDEDATWVKHASGRVAPASESELEFPPETLDRVEKALATQKPCSALEFYKAAPKVGYQFGPSFRTLLQYWQVAEHLVLAEVVAPPDRDKYLLHPLVIEAAFQASLLADGAWTQKDFTLRVPVSVSKAVIARNSRNEKEPSASLFLTAWKSEDLFNCVVTSGPPSGTGPPPLAFLEQMELRPTSVSTLEAVLREQTNPMPGCWQETWKVISSPATESLELDSCSVSACPLEMRYHPGRDLGTRQLFDKTNQLLQLLIRNKLQLLGWTDYQQPSEENVEEFLRQSGILAKHKPLVTYLLQTAGCGSVSQAEVQSLQDWLRESEAHHVLKLHELLHARLGPLLRGDEDILALLFPPPDRTEQETEQPSADLYYKRHPGLQLMLDTASSTLQPLLVQMKARQPENSKRVIRVLEVGAGSGLMTTRLLDLLKQTWASNWEYFFTDISPSFLDKGAGRFAEHEGTLHFATFDIERPPLEQGIPVEYFDLVVANLVVHATRDVLETCEHLRDTLKPGGLLCLQEGISKDLESTFVFGLVDGYWRFTDFDRRPDHCCLDVRGWEQVLGLAGFGDLECTPAYQDTFGCFLARKLNPTSPTTESRLRQRAKFLVFLPSEGNPDSPGACVLQELVDRVASMAPVTLVWKTPEPGIWKKSDFAGTELTTPDAVLDARHNIAGIVYAWSVGDSLGPLDDFQYLTESFLKVAQFLLGFKGQAPALWVVTQGLYRVTGEEPTLYPTSSLVVGMAKSLKSESPGLLIRCVDLEVTEGTALSNTARQTGSLLLLHELAFARSKSTETFQVALRQGVRYAPKLVSCRVPSSREELQVPAETDKYKVLLPKSRVLKDLRLGRLQEPGGTGQLLGDEDVEIEVKCYALNFRDLFIALRPCPMEKEETFGSDFAGVVTRVGSRVSGRQVGDRVFGVSLREGHMPSHLPLPAQLVMKIPDRLSFWQASTLPVVWCTAYHCLVNIARLQPGDTLLIHAASGGVGLAAIQLARHIGATIFATAGNQRKRAFLKGLGLSNLFHSRDTSFKEEVLRATDRRGVDVVLNSLTGPGMKEASLDCTAEGGRFIEMSKMGVWTEEEFHSRRSNVSYSIVNLLAVPDATWADLYAKLVQHLETGACSPLPFVRFSVRRLHQALEYLKEARHIGKVICSMPGKGPSSMEGDTLFTSDSRYLVTGGMGGVGFATAEWMLEKGAGRVVLMGRHPPSPSIAAKISKLNSNSAGMRVKVILGDVANLEDCKRVIAQANEDGDLPLRGIQHCAGVLMDEPFSTLSWEHFEATLRPKLLGTWNLHQLSRDMQLEHFVLHSSVSALLPPSGQANHSAANAFLDAFAAWRQGLGLPATSVNWGQWAEVGSAKHIRWDMVKPVSVRRMLNGLEGILKTPLLPQASLVDLGSFDKLQVLCPVSRNYVESALGDMNPGHERHAGILKLLEQDGSTLGRRQRVETALVGLVRRLRRLDGDTHVDPTTDLKTIGVDSLSLLEFKNTAKVFVGPDVSLSESIFTRNTTLSQLSADIVALYEQRPQEQVQGILDLSPRLHQTQIDLLTMLKCDSQLSTSIQGRIPGLTGPCTAAEMQVLLLTGATGFVGGQVLRLLANGWKGIKVTKVYCLVRGSSQLTEVPISDKPPEVTFVHGDISQPCLGLDQSTYTRLSAEVDGILHLAVSGNHVQGYEQLRTTNILGTRHVIQFATERKLKHLLYTSSFICPGSTDPAEKWPSEQSLQQGLQNQAVGYALTKLVSELLLKQASLWGAPCKALRLPFVSGESQTGRISWEQNHLLLRWLTFLKLKMLPTTPYQFPLNLVPVDLCAKICLELFFNEQAPYALFHLDHPTPQLEQDFIPVACNSFHRDLRVVPLETFVESMSRQTTPLLKFGELYTSIQRLQGTFTAFPSQNQENLSAFHRRLSDYAPSCAQILRPPVEYLRKDLEYVMKNGGLEKSSGP